MVDVNFQQLNNRNPAASDRATYSEIARWICVGGLLVTLILVYAWFQNEILKINYQMEQIQKENARLQAINDALRVEYSSLVSPEKVDRVARELGLISSNHQKVRILQAVDPHGPETENLLAETRPHKKHLLE